MKVLLKYLFLAIFLSLAGCSHDWQMRLLQDRLWKIAKLESGYVDGIEYTTKLLALGEDFQYKIAIINSEYANHFTLPSYEYSKYEKTNDTVAYETTNDTVTYETTNDTVAYETTKETFRDIARDIANEIDRNIRAKREKIDEALNYLKQGKRTLKKQLQRYELAKQIRRKTAPEVTEYLNTMDQLDLEQRRTLAIKFVDAINLMSELDYVLHSINQSNSAIFNVVSPSTGIIDIIDVTTIFANNAEMKDALNNLHTEFYSSK